MTVAIKTQLLRDHCYWPYSQDFKMNRSLLDVLAKISTFAATALASGCVMLSSSEVAVSRLKEVDKGPKVVTIQNNTPYLAEMSAALAENGFVVKPMPTQQEILEIKQAGRMAKYNEASTRWGLSILTRGSSMTCAFTDFKILYFTVMLTDIATNEAVLVLKQKGSDGPCTTIKPVFGTLSAAISKNW